jgi:hypothetical protein
LVRRVLVSEKVGKRPVLLNGEAGSDTTTCACVYAAQQRVVTAVSAGDRIVCRGTDGVFASGRLWEAAVGSDARGFFVFLLRMTRISKKLSFAQNEAWEEKKNLLFGLAPGLLDLAADGLGILATAQLDYGTLHALVERCHQHNRVHAEHLQELLDVLIGLALHGELALLLALGKPLPKMKTTSKTMNCVKTMNVTHAPACPCLIVCLKKKKSTTRMIWHGKRARAESRGVAKPAR